MFAVRGRTAPPVFAALRQVMTGEASGAEAGVLVMADGLVEHLQLFLHLLFLELWKSVRVVTVSGRRDGQRRHGHRLGTDTSNPTQERSFWERYDHLLQDSRQRGPFPRHVDVEDLHRGHALLDLLHGVPLNPLLWSSNHRQKCRTPRRLGEWRIQLSWLAVLSRGVVGILGQGHCDAQTFVT